jgi:hypothetical protein
MVQKKVKRKPNQLWTREHVRELKAMIKEGVPRAVIARKLKPKRTVGAIDQQIHKLGLSLRTTAKKAKKASRKVARAKAVERPTRIQARNPVTGHQLTGSGTNGASAAPIAAAAVQSD